MVTANLSADLNDLNNDGHWSNIVEIQHLTRRFGAKVALNDVSFSVPAGSVVGLVGENGAGKTTLIKHILGLLKAQAGSVRVFGLDPVKEPVNVLSRIGYLSEEPDMPGWMRVHELLRYIAAFYPTWDPAYAEQLREEFQLDPCAQNKTSIQGSASTSWALNRSGLSPRTTGFGRTIIGPRPDRPPRHLGAHHPHHRR